MKVDLYIPIEKCFVRAVFLLAVEEDEQLEGFHLLKDFGVPKRESFENGFMGQIPQLQ